MIRNPVSFICAFCKIKTEKPSYYFKRVKTHFCSQECSKKYRKQCLTVHNIGDKKYQLKLISYEVINEIMYYSCECDCGDKIKIPKSEFGVKRKCDNNLNHIGKNSPIFEGYGELHLTRFNQFKQGAKKRNLEFSISIEDAWNQFIKQNRQCALTGLYLTIDTYKALSTGSLDRIDSNKGYTVDNIQWVHKNINLMKLNLNQLDFIQYCHLVSKNNKIKEGLDFQDVLIVPSDYRNDDAPNSRAEVDLLNNNCTTLFGQNIPVIAANMNAVGTFSIAKALFKFKMMTCLMKHYSAKEYIDFYNSCSIDEQKLLFYSIGANQDDILKLKEVTQSINLPNICLDVANAYTNGIIEYINQINEIAPNSILMVGNIATPGIIEKFSKYKVSILKCGIGSGSVCKTRMVAGVGVPQFSAIKDCVEEAKKYNIKICSDGGIKETGDISKAICIGADLVMIGGLIAGHEECEGEWEYDGHKKNRLKFFGMSSHEAQEQFNGGLSDYRASEGECRWIPNKGNIADLCKEIRGGLASACTYIGARNIKDMGKCAEFVRVNRIK